MMRRHHRAAVLPSGAASPRQATLFLGSAATLPDHQAPLPDESPANSARAARMSGIARSADLPRARQGSPGRRHRGGFSRPGQNKPKIKQRMADSCHFLWAKRIADW